MELKSRSRSAPRRQAGPQGGTGASEDCAIGAQACVDIGWAGSISTKTAIRAIIAFRSASAGSRRALRGLGLPFYAVKSGSLLEACGVAKTPCSGTGLVRAVTVSKAASFQRQTRLFSMPNAPAPPLPTACLSMQRSERDTPLGTSRRPAAAFAAAVHCGGRLSMSEE